MDIREAIYKRRSVRKFQEKPVDDQIIKSLLSFVSDTSLFPQTTIIIGELKLLNIILDFIKSCFSLFFIT